MSKIYPRHPTYPLREAEAAAVVAWLRGDNKYKAHAEILSAFGQARDERWPGWLETYKAEMLAWLAAMRGPLIIERVETAETGSNA